MDNYFFAKADTSAARAGVPVYLERNKLFDSHEDFKEKKESKALWSQPITKRGRTIKSSVTLPDEIFVISQSLTSFSIQIYPVFGGLIIDSKIWSLFSQATTEYFLKCPARLFIDGDTEVDGDYIYLKHKSEINIVDEQSSLMIGQSSFSGTFEKISQLMPQSNAPEIFYIGDLSGRWAVLKSWVAKYFDNNIHGLELHENDEFCLRYNRNDLFTKMLSMNRT